ncbi:MAG TPA: hypothetical protein VJ439_01390 [Candidatus Bathyarchaeia archaeon]|nr:hypothetical protein [Candidatus Bathyarchaeia archaeon]
MKTEEIKTMTTVAKELSDCYADVANALNGTADTVKASKKLWRSKNNSWLIKIGLALIAFPDPTISDIVGAAFVAAGTVQMGIRRRTVYAEDVYKTFTNTFKDIRNLKQEV